MSSPAERVTAVTRQPAVQDNITLPVHRWLQGTYEPAKDNVAEEIPVALLYNGIPYAVMLTTPDDLTDFTNGFTFTEEIVGSPAEIEDVSFHYRKNGIEAHIRIPEDRARALQHRTRNIAGCTGCGICGSTSLDEAIRTPPGVGPGIVIDSQTLHRALSGIKSHQQLNSVTGSVHAAAWAAPDGEILLIREDVGRHNALDKLVGAMITQVPSVDRDAGFLVITSRASFEMIQKAALAGISLTVAISAPTALAVRLAQDCGMTLIGFARESSHVVYCHPQRFKTGNTRDK